MTRYKDTSGSEYPRITLPGSLDRILRTIHILNIKFLFSIFLLSQAVLLQIKKY